MAGENLILFSKIRVNAVLLWSPNYVQLYKFCRILNTLYKHRRHMIANPIGHNICLYVCVFVRACVCVGEKKEIFVLM